MNQSIICALLLFAVAGTIIQWAWIWHLIKRTIAVEQALAILTQKIPADHAKDTGADSAPEI